MKIENCKIEDMDSIFRLYRLASQFQKEKKTVVVWPEFDPVLIEQEIQEKRQWKLLINDTIACIWASTYSDEQIWEERNTDPAVYIHRIATNPEFRGHNFVKAIVEWARSHARDKGKQYIRLDTIGNNERLIALYQAAGFQFLGMFPLRNTDGLPSHYKNGSACLFEIDCGA